MAAHLFGYVDEVTEAQLQRPEYQGVESGDLVGQAGIEQAYNKLLMGAEGNRAVVVNSLGREIQELDKQDPVEGQRLQLTIDADVQKAIEDAFTASGLQRRRGRARSAQRRGARRSPAVRPTTRTRLPRASTVRHGPR